MGKFFRPSSSYNLRKSSHLSCNLLKVFHFGQNPAKP